MQPVRLAAVVSGAGLYLILPSVASSHSHGGTPLHHGVATTFPRRHGVHQWIDLFLPFIPVKNLYLSRDFVPRIAPTLQELVGERVTEVLPNLQSIFLEDPQESGLVPEAMRQFIAARQLSSRPITISYWNGWSTIDD